MPSTEFSVEPHDAIERANQRYPSGVCTMAVAEFSGKLCSVSQASITPAARVDQDRNAAPVARRGLGNARACSGTYALRLGSVNRSPAGQERDVDHSLEPLVSESRFSDVEPDVPARRRACLDSLVAGWFLVRVGVGE